VKEPSDSLKDYKEREFFAIIGILTKLQLKIFHNFFVPELYDDMGLCNLKNNF
jgi:hypothetical protein